MNQRLVVVVVLLLLQSMVVLSQGTITANPNAVRLRELWRVQGSGVGSPRYGAGIGGGIDVNGDGYGDFFVNFGAEGVWKLFYGGNPPDTEADWSTGSVAAIPPYPVVGEFYGDGRKVIGLGTMRKDTSNPGTAYYPQLKLFWVDGGRIADTPYVVYDPERTMGVYLGSYPAYVVDCDGDGISELVASYGGNRRNNVLDERPEVWFFKGGPEFRVDTPTVIVKDEENVPYSRPFYAGIGDIDGDGYVDMVTTARYMNGNRLKFYWGTEASPWTWDKPDRVINLGADYPSIAGNVFPAMLDIDGDGAKDLVFQGGVVYRSGSRKTSGERRERSYLLEDADVVLFGVSSKMRPSAGGYLNDSASKYEMVLMSGGGTGYWFSGGANGVDTTYEGYYQDGVPGETALINVLNVGDVNGDGWSDYGACNPDYFSGGHESLQLGVAIIFAGGPELPEPDRVAGIREIAVEDHSDGIRVWPNPVTDKLTIVWRGDLRRKPSRFVVSNVVGQEVAVGRVEPWRGSALWACGEIASGVYVVSMFDEEDRMVATISVVKR